MSVEIKYTYQNLLTTPDDNHRYELFEGELIMTPAPSRAHQDVVTNLSNMLFNYIQARQLGRLYVAPFDVYFDDETVVEPDILFISKERLHIVDEQKVNGAPDLVVEVLSESTEQRDRGFKFKRYAQEGMKEYWIVDPARKKTEIYQLGEKGFIAAGVFGSDDEVVSGLFIDLRFTAKEIWK